MTKEQLLAAGLTEAQVEGVLKLHRESIDGNFIPKHRFDEVNTELTNVKTQVTERDTQIDELKKFEGDSTALKEKITQLEESNAQKDSEYKAAILKERKLNAVKLALLEDESGKPHDIEMVMSLFNLEKVTVDEATGKLSAGFKEQNEVIRKEKTFLFTQKEEQKKPPFWKPAGFTPAEGDKKDDKKDEQATSTAFGKSLAKNKLMQLGIKPEETGKTN